MSFVEFRESVLTVMNDPNGDILGYPIDKFYTRYGKPFRTISGAADETYLYYQCSDEELVKVTVVTSCLNQADKVKVTAIGRGF